MLPVLGHGQGSGTLFSSRGAGRGNPNRLYQQEPHSARWLHPGRLDNLRSYCPPDGAGRPGPGRVLYIAGNIQPTIEGLYLTGGNAAGAGGSASGGGVYIITARATISNCIVANNTASGSGGGLYLIGSNAILTANQIVSNTSPGGTGGGLLLDHSPATLEGNLVSGNSASRGGGLWISSSEAVLYGNRIVSNTATWNGGGLYLWGGASTLINNLVARNQAAGSGNGMFLEGASRACGTTPCPAILAATAAACMSPIRGERRAPPA